MSHAPQAQFLMTALSCLAQFAARGQSLKHEHEIASLRAGAMKDMVEAVITRRIDAIESQCHSLLSMYADQAREYMAEKKSFADKILETRDAITRIELRSRLNEIDTNLAAIRVDAKLVYDRMGELLMAMGGSGLGFAGNLAATLELPFAGNAS